jgi:hypothetical protein
MAGFFTLLARAPLALRQPGELLEQTALLRQEAWLSFTADLGRERGSPAEAAFAELVAELSLDSLHKLLDALLASRAEWWASHPEAENAVAAACHDLENWLGVREDDDLAAALFNSADWQDDLACYHTLLSREGAALSSEAKRQQALENGMQALPDAAAAFSLLCDCLLTQEGNPRKLKTSKRWRSDLAPPIAKPIYVELHVSLPLRMETLWNRLGDQRALRLNRLGLTAGVAYLDTYRRLKMERGALDFNDGELETLRLLDNEEAAAALLMKLDARWKHLAARRIPGHQSAAMAHPAHLAGSLRRRRRTADTVSGGRSETIHLPFSPRRTPPVRCSSKLVARNVLPRAISRKTKPGVALHVSWPGSTVCLRNAMTIQSSSHTARTKATCPAGAKYVASSLCRKVPNDIAFRNPLMQRHRCSKPMPARRKPPGWANGSIRSSALADRAIKPAPRVLWRHFAALREAA